ncbi:putative 2-dehydropantoate 2-reductase [Bacillus sp. THAF10]|uniref:2-dehydropantoate 2-reductase n=1 Tax=Bacillus sp. THAF10 TaxID=2587848 RepID=UPI001268CBD0|nr:2-dehydropantoate 2-reductase [Bacillus sp. THAF10]QFT88767.1 putative 2-dehydropantoate 2-reductase [Bacillus sp. THAF10]
MRIAIIGGGAIGLLFSYHLRKEFHVTLYVRRDEQLARIREEGITQYKEGKACKRDVKVALMEEDTVFCEEIILVAVKQYSLPKLMEKIKNQAIDKTVLFLQNGMSHLGHLEDFKQKEVLLGVVEHGAKKRSDAAYEWTGVGQTKIAAFHSSVNIENIPFLNIWQQLLGDVFPLVFERDYHDMLMSKLMVNALINPITAIHHVKNGELLQNPHLYSLMKLLYKEVDFLISPDKREEKWEHVKKICQTTSSNFSSMERDIREGRKTEVDAILGYILNLGKKQGKALPITECMYQSIKAMEWKQTSGI